MKRRTFLHRAAAGAFLAPSIFSREARSTAVEPLRVGVITQEKGPHLSAYLRSLAQIDGVRAVGISDGSGATFTSARDALGAKVTTFRDHDRMLREFRPRAAVISLAAHKAPPLIRKALEAGCHVLAEKPSCTRAEDFEPLVQLAETRKLTLTLAFYLRVHPGAVKARELVRSGFIGKPYAAHLLVVADQTRLTRPEFHRSWLASRDTAGGGNLIWLGIHYVDLLQHLTQDRIARVSAMTRNVGGQPIDVEDSVGVTFQSRKGMVGTYHGGYYLDRGYHLGLTLWGSRGWLRFDEDNSPLEWYSTHPDAPKGVQAFPFSYEVGPYHGLVEAVLDAARGTGPPPATGEECLHVLKSIFGAYDAARTGRAQDVL